MEEMLCHQCGRPLPETLAKYVLAVRVLKKELAQARLLADCLEAVAGEKRAELFARLYEIHEERRAA